MTDSYDDHTYKLDFLIPSQVRNCLKSGWSNLDDHAEWPKNWLPNRTFGGSTSNFSGKRSVCALLVLQNMCLASRFYTGGRGGGGQIQAGFP